MESTILGRWLYCGQQLGPIIFFESWEENGVEVSTEAVFEFVVEAERILTANFVLDSYEITTNANPTGGGTINGVGTYMGEFGLLWPRYTSTLRCFDYAQHRQAQDRLAQGKQETKKSRLTKRFLKICLFPALGWL